MVSVPNTGAQLSHAMTIRTAGALSTTVGAVNQWSAQHNRTLTDLFEFGPVDTRYASVSGEPFEVVPGNVGGLSINVRRWDLYTTQYENAFGSFDLTMLSGQTDAITLREVWATPNRANDYALLYLGSWFENVGREMSAVGDRTINAGGSIRYTRKQRIRV